MRVLFLNQYFPPDPAPTGILLKEIADALVERGHEAIFVSAAQDYRGGQGKGGRMKRELGGLWRILRGALAAGPVDAIVSATSPPLLVVVAAFVAKARRARHYHWLFDMYPELATALGEIKDGALARLFRALTRWAYRGARCVVVLDDDMAARLGSGVKTAVIPPWVFHSLIGAREMAVAAAIDRSRSSRKIWLYSGNLGRAHEWRTLLDAQALLEKSGAGYTLIFQGGGPGWTRAREYAESLKLQHCEWRGYVPEADLPASLLAADILVVTQRPETQGLLWPSKLALVKTLPRQILWVGPTDGAIAHSLAAVPQAGVFAPGAADAVAAWLQKFEFGDIVVGNAEVTRNQGLEFWVSNLVEGGSVQP